MSALEFWSGWWWPLATAVIGFVFTWLVFDQWLHRRKPHQLAWSVGLLMYAVAASMEAVSEYRGDWNPVVYRFYIVLAASMVGLPGTRLVLPDREDEDRSAHLPRACSSAGRSCSSGASFNTELRHGQARAGHHGGRSGARRRSTFPRIMSLPFNITGSIFLLGGALISIWRFARKQEFAYRMWANVLIAIGTIMHRRRGQHGARGTQRRALPCRDGRLGDAARGFLMAGTLDKGAKESMQHGKERRAREAAARAAEEMPPPT